MPWVWVQETGDTFGQNAHILLHVPPELANLFRPMPRRWAKAINSGVYMKGAVQSQRLAGARAIEANPDRYRAELLGMLHYMLKCAPAPLEYRLDTGGWGHKHWGQLACVVGKRAAAWQRH